jgi:hypothetical protein
MSIIPFSFYFFSFFLLFFYFSILLFFPFRSLLFFFHSFPFSFPITLSIHRDKSSTFRRGRSPTGGSICARRPSPVAPSPRLSSGVPHGGGAGGLRGDTPPPHLRASVLPHVDAPASSPAWLRRPLALRPHRPPPPATRFSPPAAAIPPSSTIG